MKKVAILVIMLLSFVTTAYAYTVNPLGSVTLYTRNRVYVRDMATVNSGSLGILDFGVPVTAFYSERDNTGKEWIFASTSLGDGFVSANSLSKEKQAEPADYKGEKTMQQESDNIYEAKSVVNAQSLSLVTSTDAPALKSDGSVYAIVPAGKHFSASRFYVFGGDAYAQVWYHGSAYYISTYDIQMVNGGYLPYLPGQVQLKTNCLIEGEVLSAGKTMNVQFYILGADGKVYAYCYEGYLERGVIK